MESLFLTLGVWASDMVVMVHLVDALIVMSANIVYSTLKVFCLLELYKLF